MKIEFDPLNMSPRELQIILDQIIGRHGVSVRDSAGKYYEIQSCSLFRSSVVLSVVKMEEECIDENP